MTLLCWKVSTPFQCHECKRRELALLQSDALLLFEALQKQSAEYVGDGGEFAVPVDDISRGRTPTVGQRPYCKSTRTREFTSVPSKTNIDRLISAWEECQAADSGTPSLAIFNDFSLKAGPLRLCLSSQTGTAFWGGRPGA